MNKMLTTKILIFCQFLSNHKGIYVILLMAGELF